MPIQEPKAVQQLNKMISQYAELMHPPAFVRGVIFAVASAPEIPMPQQ
jgi:hypothetical protein